MVSAVLAGPDGKTPAIEAETGQPLTIEELLRRRGFVAVGGNMHLPMSGDSATTSSDPASGGAVAAAMAARNGGSSATSGVVASPNAQPAVAVDPNTGQPVPVMSPAASSDSSMDTSGLGYVAGAAGAGAAGYALYKAMKNRKRAGKAAGLDAKDFGAPANAASRDVAAVDKPTVNAVMEQRNANGRVNPNMSRVDGAIPNNMPIPEGEFEEVNALPSALKRALANPATRRALMSVVR